MNQVQTAMLKALGYTHEATKQRDGQWIAIAIKPMPSGGQFRSEAGGRTPDDAERSLIKVLTRK